MAPATALMGAVSPTDITCLFVCSAACCEVMTWPGPPGASVGPGMRILSPGLSPQLATRLPSKHAATNLESLNQASCRSDALGTRLKLDSNQFRIDDGAAFVHALNSLTVNTDVHRCNSSNTDEIKILLDTKASSSWLFLIFRQCLSGPRRAPSASGRAHSVALNINSTVKRTSCIDIHY